MVHQINIWVKQQILHNPWQLQWQAEMIHKFSELCILHHEECKQLVG